MNAILAEHPAIAMARPVSCLLEGVAGDTGTVEDLATDASFEWAEDRIAALVPAGPKADLALELIGPIASCFTDVETFDRHAVAFHDWLVGLGDVHEMRSLSSLAQHNGELWGVLDCISDETITDALRDTVLAALGQIEDRCIYVFDGIPSAHKCMVTMLDDTFQVEVVADEGDSYVIVSDAFFGYEAPVDPSAPKKLSGSLVPAVIKGRVSVSDTRIDGEKVTLTASITNARGHCIYGPLEVSDRKVVDMFLHYRSQPCDAVCDIAQPTVPGRHPVVVRCTDPTC